LFGHKLNIRTDRLKRNEMKARAHRLHLILMSFQFISFVSVAPNAL